MTSEILAWLQELRDGFGIDYHRVLEVGSRDVNGSPRSIFQVANNEYIGVDLEPGPGVDVVGRWSEVSKRWWAHNGGRALFDLVICCETLEHTADPIRMVDELRYWLHRGGHLILTSPANGFPLHRFPRDYWRLMPDVYEDILLAGMDVIDHRTTSDPCECWAARAREAAKGIGE